MKKITSNMIYGDMPPEIPELFAATVQKDRVRKKVRPLTIILVAVLLILAMACTAIAVGYRRSIEYEATGTARQALTETYGIQPEWYALFSETLQKEEGGWTVTFEPIDQMEKLGSYTVSISPKGVASPSWAHDGVDISALEDQGLSSDIWAAKQIEAWMHVWEEYVAKRHELIEGNGGWVRLSQEDWLALDSILLESGYYPDGMLHKAGNEDDLTDTQAIELAKEAIQGKYGVEMVALDVYDVDTQFAVGADGQSAVYRVQLHFRGDPERNQTDGAYEVEILSPAGNVVRCMREIDYRRNFLPEGDLGRYAAAVWEYVEYGAFDSLTDKEKAEASSRIIDSGLGEYIGNIRYIDPSLAKTEKKRAMDIARDALGEKYRLTDEMLAYFDIKASFTVENGENIWSVTCEMPYSYRWYNEFSEKLGIYRVGIDDATAQAQSVSWSHDGLPGRAAPYAESTWAVAPAWDADVFHLLIQFAKKANALSAEMEDERNDYYTCETKLHTLFRDAGFDRKAFPMGFPSNEEVQREAAWAIVREVLITEYGLSAKEIAQMGVNSGFYVSDSENPYWYIWAYCEDRGRVISYAIMIDGKTGEVLSVETRDALTNG